MKYGTSQFHDWIYKNSLAEYKKYSKILKNPKDDLEEIGFRISSVRCSFLTVKKILLFMSSGLYQIMVNVQRMHLLRITKLI